MTIQLQDIDLTTLETVVGGGALAIGAGAVAAAGTAYATAPLAPVLAAAGGLGGLSYGAVKGVTEGYARNGVVGAITEGTGSAIKHGLSGAIAGPFLPGVVAGLATHNLVQRWGG